MNDESYSEREDSNSIIIPKLAQIAVRRLLLSGRLLPYDIIMCQDLPASTREYARRIRTAVCREFLSKAYRMNHKIWEISGIGVRLQPDAESMAFSTTVRSMPSSMDRYQSLFEAFEEISRDMRNQPLHRLLIYAYLSVEFGQIISTRPTLDLLIDLDQITASRVRSARQRIALAFSPGCDDAYTILTQNSACQEIMEDVLMRWVSWTNRQQDHDTGRIVRLPRATKAMVIELLAKLALHAR